MNQVTNVCRCAFPSHDCLHPRGPWKESEVLNQLPEEPQKLVGGFNPFEKYQSNWESSPNRGEHKKYLKPPPSFGFVGFYLEDHPMTDVSGS